MAYDKTKPTYPGGNAQAAFDAIKENFACLEPAVGQLAGNRNKIINGDMRILQRYATATDVTPANGDYVVDRFRCGLTQESKYKVRQTEDAPAGFKYSSLITSLSAYTPAAGDTFFYSQPVEGQNMLDMQFGLATAKTITLSFWVKGSVAGDYSVALFNGGLNRSYIGTYAVTTSWAQQTVTLTAATTGTWAADNTVGAYISWDLGSGSDYETAAGSWVNTWELRTSGNVTFISNNAATLNITGVQLEVGSVATPFEFRMNELQLCQRYLPYFRGTADQIFAAGNTYTATLGVLNIPFPVQVRTTPTGIVVSASNAIKIATTAAFTASAITFNSATLLSGGVDLTISGATAGQGGVVKWAVNGYLYFTGCEL